ncbi:hypothetical protein Z043_119347 [Scleropages formosus]|uniref:Uncharacterized protein n=1 Tax=Scleropages formosus TaxID=113540 RepID=A0A0P7WN18_SCLFO|nr:hypothetical protein Z043_119347 [Scleropages formosus]
MLAASHPVLESVHLKIPLVTHDAALGGAGMLCESMLWRMAYCQDFTSEETPASLPGPWRREGALSELAAAVTFSSCPQGTRAGVEAPSEMLRTPERVWRWGRSGASNHRGTQSQTVSPCRRTSPGVNIPGSARSGGEAFLNYSDLLIAGDQVLPLSASADDLMAGSTAEPADGPFLQSCEIPPAMDSPPSSLEYPQRPIRRGDSSCWRAGSTKERSLLLGGQQPLSNSLLNHYLEQKVVDLYRQHMMESMAHGRSPSTVLASELMLTSVDQITLQLSREQNLEATRAKDMVISCLRRVASGLQSSEISTPLLQISVDST